MNRVKSKLFLITTFLLPFFMGGMMYLPSMLMDLEPEETSEIGLVYQDDILDLVHRFEAQISVTHQLKNGKPQFIFSRFDSDQFALDSVVSKSIDGFMIIPPSVTDTGEVEYYSLSLSNIKIYTQLRRVLNQVVIEQRMIDQNIDMSLVGQLSRRISFETFKIDEDGKTSEGDGFISFIIPF
ncbi:MAG: ABC transporter permease, partial [Candidatus Marinimicrobia bacterium]|nr:ABC transporter permease [Candidatus Neomarinimicrobiota bacterium]